MIYQFTDHRSDAPWLGTFQPPTGVWMPPVRTPVTRLWMTQWQWFESRNVRNARLATLSIFAGGKESRLAAVLCREITA
jgi:hypothetical protein